MSRYEPTSLLDKLLGAAITLLLAALALNWAVGLLLEVWKPLVAIVSVILAGTVAFMVWRVRRGGW
ncbi:MAG: hypothetical protein V9G19_04220 [Tetrasphaera sp.]